MTDLLITYPYAFSLPNQSPSRLCVMVPSVTGTTLHVYTGTDYKTMMKIVVDDDMGTCIGMGGSTNNIIVMGTTQGDLIVIDVMTGDIIHKILGAHMGKVTGLVVTSSGTIAYTVCETETGLIEWDLIHGDRKRVLDTGLKGMRRVTVYDNIVCCGAEKLCVIDTIQWKLIKTLTGHATPVTQIILSPTTSHIYTVAHPDRCVYQWSLKATQSSSTENDHVMYSTESNLMGIGLRGDGQYLCGVTETGEAYIWKTETKTMKKNVKEVKMRFMVKQIGMPDYDIPIRYVVFSGDHVTLGYGSNILNPVFEMVKMEQVIGDDGLVKLERDDKTMNDKTKKKKTKKDESVNVIGSIEMPQATLVDVKSSDELVDDQVKMDLVKGIVRRPTTSMTLQQMLTQAIMSNDSKLLEKCFEVTDKNMIMGTVDRLDPVHVITLVDLLVIRLQRKPNRAVNLVEWIRCVLMRHAGYLMSVPACAVKLGSLYRTLDTRQDVMKKMMRLYGRLDLVVGQFEMRKNVSTAAAVVVSGGTNGDAGDGVGEVDDDGVLVYEDEDDEISDDEMSEEEEEEEEEMMEE